MVLRILIRSTSQISMTPIKVFMWVKKNVKRSDTISKWFEGFDRCKKADVITITVTTKENTVKTVCG